MCQKTLCVAMQVGSRVACLVPATQRSLHSHEIQLSRIVCSLDTAVIGTEESCTRVHGNSLLSGSFISLDLISHQSISGQFMVHCGTGWVGKYHEDVHLLTCISVASNHQALPCSNVLARKSAESLTVLESKNISCSGVSAQILLLSSAACGYLQKLAGF
jgi:hypothetical protein